MNRSSYICLSVVFAVIHAAPASGKDWELDQAIHAAMTKPAVQDYDLEIARARKRLLDAMNKRRLELTPQVGLLTLTNPALVATSLGAGLLWRQNAVSPFLVYSAELDVIAAEMSLRRWRFQREIDVTDRYFELSRYQRVAKQACLAARETEARRREVVQQFSLARMTRVDVLQYEQELLDRQVECRQSEWRTQSASRNLSVLISVAADSLQVADVPEQGLNIDYPMQPVEHLVQVAMIHRSEPALLRDDLAALRRKVEAARKPRAFQFGLRYNYLGQQGTGLAGSGYLLGGHSLLPEVSARISLKDSGEFNAEKQVLLLRISRLNQEAQEIEQEIRARISDIHAGFESWRDEIQWARRRLALSSEHRGITAARQRAGLESMASLRTVENNERRAGMDVVQLEYEGSSKVAAILSICGLQDTPLARRELLLTRQLSVSAEVHGNPL